MYQGCGVTPSSISSKEGPADVCGAVAGAKVELLVVCSLYQMCGVIPSMGKEGPADGL